MTTVAQPGSRDDLVRLRREREQAERAYGEALTALDAAVQRARQIPNLPPGWDDVQAPRLNEQWALLEHGAAEGGGWFRRVRAHVWAMVEPLFARQEAFNAALVDHVNRNLEAQRAAGKSLADALAIQREEQIRLVEFETKLILWAQQITAYVDTKDRYVAQLPSGLATVIGRVGDELLRRWESATAADERQEAQIADLRTTVGVVQRALHTLRRELEVRAAGPADRLRPGPGRSGEASAEAETGSQGRAEVGPAEAEPLVRSALDAYKYVGFEDNFRGAVQDIRARQAEYLPYFEGASDVLDVGCGRGEFLDLLRQRGITARGVDINDEMAAICRARGLDATAGDSLAYLEALPDESLGGLFTAQVVEHLEPQYLMRLLDTAYRKMRPGSTIILETINPACWYAFFSSYIRDITHVRPLHPDTLRYLLVASGFQRTSLRYSAPFPEESKLQPVRVHAQDGGQGSVGADDPDDALRGMAEVFNENVSRLNELLFTYLDYAAIGERI